MKAYLLAALIGTVHATVFSFAFLSGIVSLYFVAKHVSEKAIRVTLVVSVIIFISTFFVYAWKALLMYQNALTCMATT